MIHLIVAIDAQRGIGRNNDLLCYLPADLKNFKALTSGQTVIMGRRTFESLPKGALPNRVNIVISRTPRTYADTLWAASLQEAIAMAPKDRETYIIGGASIYALALPDTDVMHITQIKHAFDDVDTFFPEWEQDEWEEIARETHLKDEKNAYDFDIITYKRK